MKVSRFAAALSVLVSALIFLLLAVGPRPLRRASREAWRTARAAAQVVHPQPVVILRIWNERRGAAVRVELFESGRLVVDSPARIERQLPRESTVRMIDAAQAAFGDFNSEGCETAADGPSAGLDLMIDGRRLKTVCRNASGWPKGAATRALLADIRRHLPDAFQPPLGR